MKKIVLVITIVLGMGIGTFAQEGGGLFGRGESQDAYSYGSRDGNNSCLINLPNQHGTGADQEAPIGSGALLLIGFSAAYMAAKKKKQ